MPFDITLSIGEVVCTDPDESLSSVIRQADYKLYENKRQKRVA